MNECSVMAKSIDTTKLERIKDATVEMVVKHGYNAASVSSIAKQAGVADGYLYRFYSSKYALVSDIFKSKVEGLADVLQDLVCSKKTVRAIVEDFVGYILYRAKEYSVQTKFLFMLIHDYSFEIDKEASGRLRELFEQILSKGRKSGEIAETITAEDLYLLIIGQTLLYIDSRFRNHFGRTEFDPIMADRVSDMCLKAIK